MKNQCHRLMNTIIQRLCFVLLFTPAWMYAQVAGKNNDVLLVKHVADFKVTGAGDASEWRTTGWVPLVKRKGASDYLTQAKLLYSDSGIYGLFSCKDKKITATL